MVLWADNRDSALVTPEPLTGPVSLEVRGVHCRYGDTVALADVNARVEPARCVALVGESGSGKSTLLRCFNGMVRPESGEVCVAGAEVGSVPQALLRRRIGYVPQNGGLLPHWRVLRNVALVPALLGHADAPAVARQALELVGLDPALFADRFPHELSGGQRQRVALARALAGRPAVLLMDEPFGALDAITRSDLQSAFAALRRRLSVTTVLVTHDLLEADRVADELIVLHTGRIEQRDSLSALRARPATAYVSALLQRAFAAAPGGNP